MKKADGLGRILIPVVALLCLHPLISSGEGLLLGLMIALLFGNPYLAQTRRLTHRLLALAVVGMGAGMDLGVVGKVGMQGVGYTVIGISFTLILGFCLGRAFKTDPDTSVLVTVGTAICGGSAIAAVSPVIRAKHHEISVSLGVVFLLNAVALFTFPSLGHYFQLSQTQFGLWCALAIHDTSSVVGASLQYGAEALQIATTVKLARALWIIPVSFFIGYLYSRKENSEPAVKVKKPIFILGFVLAAALVTFIPTLQPAGHRIDTIAKRVLVATLFLIGASLTRETIRNVGFKPLLQGICLWLTVGSLTLWAIISGWIHA